MTEKEQLIARVAELSAKLGRDADTTGTVAELKARIDELEAELEEGNTILPGAGDNSSVAVGQQQSGTPLPVAEQHLVGIIPKVTLHLRLGTELILAVKGELCFVDAAQARQVVEVEQHATYADE